MRGTMVRTDILAQASSSRLGKSSRSSPWFSARARAQADGSRFERWTISLRREGPA